MSSKDKNKKNVSPNVEMADDAEIIDEDTVSAQDAEDACITLTAQEIEKLRADIKKMDDARSDAIATAQRLQAEFDNYRKRNASLRTDSINEGTNLVILKLLPALDSFERGLAAAVDGDSFADGMKLVYRQLLDSLTKLGLTEIQADGVFDPNLHDAVLFEECEGFESGTIIEVLQKGYMVNSRIIRHSMVKVAK